jgi:hypothetical protein
MTHKITPTNTTVNNFLESIFIVPSGLYRKFYACISRPGFFCLHPLRLYPRPPYLVGPGIEGEQIQDITGEHKGSIQLTAYGVSEKPGAC